MTTDRDLEQLSREERSLLERLGEHSPADPPGTLRARIEASASGRPQPASVRPRPVPFSWRLLVGASMAAALLMIAISMLLWSPWQEGARRRGREGNGGPPRRPAEVISAGPRIVHVTLSDGTRVRLYPGARSTRLALAEQSAPPGGAAVGGGVRPQARVVSVLAGRARFDVAEQESPFEARTPACTARVAGTTFEVNVTRASSKGGTEMTSKKLKHLVTVAVLAGAVTVFNPLGEVGLAAGEQAVVEEGQAPSKANIDALAAMFTDHYKPVKADAKPGIPAYKLPVDLSAVANYAAVNQRLKADRFKALVTKNGFAVVPWEVHGLGHLHDFQGAYKMLKNWEVPVFVTSDSLLHLYHIQFDETLKGIEERVFAGDLQVLLTALQSRLLGDWQKATGEMKTSLGIALGQVTVSLQLLTDVADALGPLKVAREAAGKLNAADYRAAGRFRSQHQKALGLFGEIGRQIGAPVPHLHRRNKAQVLAAMDKVIAHVQKVAQANPAGRLPAELKAKSAAELKQIAAHQGYAESLLFGYKEDYSQYVPRGHYTRSELLKRYFKSMMYLGRMTFLLRGRQDTPAGISALVDTADAKRQTLAAAHLTRLLMTAKAPDGRRLADIWQRIYAVTSYYVGVADDLTFRDYGEALAKVIGPDLDVARLLDDGVFFQAKVELAKLRGPAIYSGTGDVELATWKALSGVPSPEDLAKVLELTMGLRVMGQRFVPDSYVMGKLVFPTVGAWRGGEFAFTTGQTQVGPRRVWPRSLDVLDVFGSGRAAGLLTQVRDDRYEGYAEAVGKLRTEFDKLTALDWNRNLYWSWIYSLKGLTLPADKGYPTFMQTLAWQNRQQHAAAASWSQLRHDTILYAKQSYTMVGSGLPPRPKDVPGYVEPSVEFYARLLSLARMTHTGLAELKVLDDAAVKRLETLDKIIQQLLDISVKELANKPLTAEEYEFIKYFGERLTETLRGVDKKGRDTRIVADVHTDGNSRQVLEEGTGPIDLMLVVYRLPDGALGMGVGPTLSYYEFKHPMSDRLTDEAWQQLLGKERDKAAVRRPNWAGSFLAPVGSN